jgi:hypothetical protein
VVEYFDLVEGSLSDGFNSVYIGSNDSKKNHMIRTGIEPASSDNRSPIVPLKIYVLKYTKYVQDSSDQTEVSRTIPVRGL